MSLKQASIGKNLLDIVSQSKKGLIDLSRNANDLVTVIKSIDNIDDIGKVLNLSGVSKDFVASALKANGMKDSVDDVIKAMDRFADSQKGISGVGLGFKGLGLILESMAPTLLGIAAIGGTIFALYKYFNAYNDAVKQAGESQSAYVQTAQEVQSLNSELETTQERIAELQALQSAGTITIAEENELNNLKLQNEELERQIKLKQQLSDEQSEQAVKDAMAALAYEGTYDSTQKEDYLIDETGQQIAVSKKTDLLTAAQNEVNKLAKLKDQRRKLLENNGSDEELKAVDAEITVLENKLTTEISDVNARQGKSLQDQITELKNSLTNPFVIVEGKTTAETISGYSSYVQRNVTIDIPSGYTYIGIVDAWTSSGHVFVTNRWQSSVTDTQVTVTIYGKNIITSDTSVYFLASVLCVKTGLVSS